MTKLKLWELIEAYRISGGSEEHHARKEQLDAVLDGLLAQPEQEPKRKYRRGDRLLCLETEEWCVIHISGTDRQWVKFPDSHIGVYTNEQVADMFELIPKEPEQEPVAWMYEQARFGPTDLRGQQWKLALSRLKPWNGDGLVRNVQALYTTPPQRTWVGLTDEEICECAGIDGADTWIFETAYAIEAKLKEKNT